MQHVHSTCSAINRNGEIYLLVSGGVINSLWIIEITTCHPLPVVGNYEKS